MKILFNLLAAILLLTPFCLAQDPLPVLKSSWKVTVQKAVQVETPTTGPARLMTADDSNIARTNRAAMTDHPQDPRDMSPDGRRAAIEKNEQEARTPQPQDVKGFQYSATVRNDGAKTVKVIYWEYRFTELANSANVSRRQFVCSINLKKGGEMDLAAFSTLSPSDTIDAESLQKAAEKLFDEKVLVNRIEFADGTLLQRGNWKFEDVQKTVEHLTQKPTGKENCSAL
ncbi:MAG: hypothetical protein ABJA02_14825 [Acidobacteriota bacterium]